MSQNRKASSDTSDERSAAPTGTDSDMAIGARSEPRRGGFRIVARRVRAWSGNFLATCVILVLGLVFGRQVLQWWRDEPAPVVVPHASPGGGRLADPEAAHLLAFGDVPLTLERTVFRGDEQAALAELRRRCRQWVERRDGAELPPLPASVPLLRRLAQRPSVEEGEGWRIVENGGPVITVFALRALSLSEPSTKAQSSQTSESVVSWGLGLRRLDRSTDEEARSGRWTLFTCSGADDTAAFGPNLLQPIPPGSRRTLAMHVTGGGALIGFAGHGAGANWRRFFDQSFAARGWTCVGSWSRIGAGWHARFQRPGHLECEVQLTARADDGMSGILTVVSVGPDLEN